MDIEKQKPRKPDYYLKPYNKTIKGAIPQYLNRHCACVDVKVNGDYACSVQVSLPKDNSPVKKKDIMTSARLSAKRLSKMVRTARKKDITAEITGILDFSGKIK